MSHQISFSPHNLQVCVSGNSVLKMFRYSEGVLKQSSIAKVESINFLCHTWVSEDRVVAGTDTGRLLVYESGDLRSEIKMSSKEVQGQNDRSDFKIKFKLTHNLEIKFQICYTLKKNFY